MEYPVIDKRIFLWRPFGGAFSMLTLPVDVVRLSSRGRKKCSLGCISGFARNAVSTWGQILTVCLSSGAEKAEQGCFVLRRACLCRRQGNTEWPHEAHGLLSTGWVTKQHGVRMPLRKNARMVFCSSRALALALKDLNFAMAAS